jgi:hypothetical protein
MAIDWTKIYKKYKGLWVALAEDEQTVLGSGKTAKQALLSAREKGNNSPILTRMPESIVSYVGAL